MNEMRKNFIKQNGGHFEDAVRRQIQDAMKLHRIDIKTLKSLIEQESHIGTQTLKSFLGGGNTTVRTLGLILDAFRRVGIETEFTIGPERAERTA